MCFNHFDKGIQIVMKLTKKKGKKEREGKKN